MAESRGLFSTFPPLRITWAEICLPAEKRPTPLTILCYGRRFVTNLSTAILRTTVSHLNLNASSRTA